MGHSGYVIAPDKKKVARFSIVGKSKYFSMLTKGSSKKLCAKIATHSLPETVPAQNRPRILLGRNRILKDVAWDAACFTTAQHPHFSDLPIWNRPHSTVPFHTRMLE